MYQELIKNKINQAVSKKSKIFIVNSKKVYKFAHSK